MHSFPVRPGAGGSCRCTLVWRRIREYLFFFLPRPGPSDLLRSAALPGWTPDGRGFESRGSEGDWGGSSRVPEGHPDVRDSASCAVTRARPSTGDPERPSPMSCCGSCKGISFYSGLPVFVFDRVRCFGPFRSNLSCVKTVQTPVPPGAPPCLPPSPAICPPTTTSAPGAAGPPRPLPCRVSGWRARGGPARRRSGPGLLRGDIDEVVHLL